MPHFTAPDGTSLHYLDEGEGTPVLALAGLTRNVADFDFLAPHLEDVRLVRMDYRGRGGSDWSGAATYNPPTEAADAVALLDHLGIDKAAVVGTSRGGIVAMILAASARDRLSGVCLVDIGPELMPEGLSFIDAYLGKPPAAKTLAEFAVRRAKAMTGFHGVPDSRWLEEAQRHYEEGPEGLSLRYDPALRDAFLEAMSGEQPDLWPLFDLMQGLPLALIRGANSDLLSEATAAEMQRRRPDMVYANVPGRGHVPFLDEPEALEGIRAWLEKIA